MIAALDAYGRADARARRRHGHGRGRAIDQRALAGGRGDGRRRLAGDDRRGPSPRRASGTTSATRPRSRIEDAAFDLVTLNNMIPFFDELARVTAPGGYVAIAYSMGPKTPIWVPLERVRDELAAAGVPARCELRGRRRRRCSPRRSSPRTFATRYPVRTSLFARLHLAALHSWGQVAQLVEHTAENRGVAGSSPALAIRVEPHRRS